MRVTVARAAGAGRGRRPDRREGPMNETMTDAGPAARPPFRRRLWHPGILLAILDFLGLCIAEIGRAHV